MQLRGVHASKYRSPLEVQRLFGDKSRCIHRVRLRGGLSVITGQPFGSHSKNSSRKALFSWDLGFSGEGALLPVQILAGQRRWQSPNELRFFLSHFLRCRTSLKLIGPETATRSCGDALHVNGIRLIGHGRRSKQDRSDSID